MSWLLRLRAAPGSLQIPAGPVLGLALVTCMRITEKVFLFFIFCRRRQLMTVNLVYMMFR